ncbi:MAG: hypothetical protein QN120_09445 [Armatimonadota bacterium]|nr:hypothetical protein [Armatimonadota bacterium]
MAPAPEDQGPDIAYLSSSVYGLESRLLRLVRESAGGGIPLDDFVTELSLLAKDVRRLFRQAGEARQRRDLHFSAAMKLQEISDHCVWLYRKIQLERAFFEKLYYESRLRSVASDDVYTLSQRLVQAEALEQQFSRATDEQLRRELLDDQPDGLQLGTVSPWMPD